MEYSYNCPVCSQLGAIYGRDEVQRELRARLSHHGVYNEISSLLLGYLFLPGPAPKDASPEAQRGFDMLRHLLAGHIPANRQDKRVLDPVEITFILAIDLLLTLHRKEGVMDCYKNRFYCQTALIVLDTTSSKQLKQELQDHFFSFVSPSTYQYIITRLPAPRDKIVKTQTIITDKLQTMLKKQGIRGEITSRIKSTYSTFRKTQRKQIQVHEVDDLLGFRIVTDSMEDCYRSLEVIQRKWGKRNQEVQDYIKQAKESGYQSIHLHLSIKHIPVEFQIRDKAMHHSAEHGRAAHGEYKLLSSYAQEKPFILRW